MNRVILTCRESIRPRILYKEINVLRKEDENYFARVLCVSSSFWLLRVESRYFSQAEKERTTWKAEQIHKMTNTFAQNCPRF